MQKKTTFLLVGYHLSRSRQVAIANWTTSCTLRLGATKLVESLEDDKSLCITVYGTACRRSETFLQTLQCRGLWTSMVQKRREIAFLFCSDQERLVHLVVYKGLQKMPGNVSNVQKASGFPIWKKNRERVGQMRLTAWERTTLWDSRTE